ncbi:MAG: hypothetical protein HY658_14855 [Actinobacteria bacterium]|nr:hypothetical protein [Actinomycetota bacterium]
MGDDRRRVLARQEEAAWDEFHEVLGRLSWEEMLEPGDADDRSVKDLLAHLGCWMAEAVQQMERMRMGTYEGWHGEVDEMNARFHEAMKDVDLSAVRSEWVASRNRMLQEWAALDEVDDEAVEWFDESGPHHHREHLAELRSFVERTRPGSGPSAAPAPEIPGRDPTRP